MKFKTLQIVWHERKPVFTVDFLSNESCVTGGGDKIIRTWRVKLTEKGDPTVVLESELTGMNGAINCLRASPKGDMFAVGGDKGEVAIWKKNPDYQSEVDYSKPWRPSCFLRGHADDVLDLSWSSDGTCLATASLEGVTIVWDTIREKAKARLCEHHHYVQGVAWDPFNQFLITQGGDRRCKVYTLPANSKKEAASRSATDWKIFRTLFKMKIQSGSESMKNFLFHDDTLTSFFRRLDWSPEGSFLVIPSGAWMEQEDKPSIHVAYIYSRGKWSYPLACLPAPGEPFVVVRFCPVLFQKATDANQNDVVDSPYEIIFACATLHTLLVYRASDLCPLAFFSGLHYSEITDLTWSPDGQYLLVSSTDGYCSVVMFEEGDLGIKYDISNSVSESCSDWLKTLEEVKMAVDPVTVKKRPLPQKLEKNEPRKDDLLPHQNRPKRRITPVAVSPDDPIKKPSSSNEAEKRIEADVSKLLAPRPVKDICSDLKKYVEETNPPEEEKTERSFSDFLTMTKNYANSRFG